LASSTSARRVSGKARAAVWRDISWEKKLFEPQFLLKQEDYIGSFDNSGEPKIARGLKVGFMDVSSATNARTMIASLTYDMPHGNKVPVLVANGERQAKLNAALCAVLNSFTYDFAMRARLGGLTLNYFILEETPLPRLAHTEQWLDGLALGAFALGAPHERFAPAWLELCNPEARRVSWRAHWALSSAERVRRKCILDAMVAALFGLSEADLAWILRDCDHPRELLSDKAFCRKLDPKGFWRIDKALDPELRHTVLTLVAFSDLMRIVAENDGDLAKGLQTFVSINAGEGWLLPDYLRLKDRSMGHDQRAEEVLPVAFRFGKRTLDAQRHESVGASWAECESHAVKLDSLSQVELDNFVPVPGPSGIPRVAPVGRNIQLSMFDGGDKS
jgi:hypothetical protein